MDWPPHPLFPARPGSGRWGRGSPPEMPHSSRIPTSPLASPVPGPAQGCTETQEGGERERGDQGWEQHRCPKRETCSLPGALAVTPGCAGLAGPGVEAEGCHRPSGRQTRLWHWQPLVSLPRGQGKSEALSSSTAAVLREAAARHHSTLGQKVASQSGLFF